MERPSNEDSTETTAFLNNGTETDSRATPDAERKRYLPHVLGLSALTMFAMYHLFAPRTRLLELALCYSHYQAHDPSAIIERTGWPWYDIPERACKLDSIQQRLAFLRSWGTFLEPLPALFTSIPHGILADKYGRKSVYALGVTGLVLSYVWYIFVCTYPAKIPNDAILASFAFLLVGGAPAYLIAIMITMVADVTSESDRSLSLYYLLSVQYAGGLFGTASSSIAMRLPVLPFLLALLAILLASLILAFIPRAILGKKTGKTSRPSSPLQSSQDTSEPNIKRLVLRNPLQGLSRIRRHLDLVTVMLMFSLIAIRLPLSTDLVLPYVSDRYGWSISNAGLLLAIGNIIDLCEALFVLPRVVPILQNRYRRCPSTVDLYIAHYCSIALCAGSLLAGIAPNIPLFVLGYVAFSTGFPIRMSIQAYTTSLVSPQHIARLYSIMAVAETVGDLLGDPLLWKAWSVGISAHGAGMGLPWFTAAMAFAVVTTTLWTLDGEKGSSLLQVSRQGAQPET